MPKAGPPHFGTTAVAMHSTTSSGPHETDDSASTTGRFGGADRFDQRSHVQRSVTSCATAATAQTRWYRRSVAASVRRVPERARSFVVMASPRLSIDDHGP
jgi:hypothetical protein